MKRTILVTVIACLMTVANIASADIFGTGANQFTIDFVNISGDASSANGTEVSPQQIYHTEYKTFTDPDAYRIGKFEITNNQWSKFQAEYGILTGNPISAYDQDSSHTGSDQPANAISWLEAAQFINWLNTSTVHQAAYKFTGTQGTTDYALSIWDNTDSGYDELNPYRNSNAFYFIPTESEWAKAAYWNGANFQQFATIPGDSIQQGDGISGTGWNYYDSNNGHANVTYSPWAVGSGSEELNGTYDMMGNIGEWVENPYWVSGQGVDSKRRLRGGQYNALVNHVKMQDYIGQYQIHPTDFDLLSGFRVASIPEPATLLLFVLGGLILRRRRTL